MSTSSNDQPDGDSQPISDDDLEVEIAKAIRYLRIKRRQRSCDRIHRALAEEGIAVDRFRVSKLLRVPAFKLTDSGWACGTPMLWHRKQPIKTST